MLASSNSPGGTFFFRWKEKGDFHFGKCNVQFSSKDFPVWIFNSIQFNRVKYALLSTRRIKWRDVNGEHVSFSDPIGSGMREPDCREIMKHGIFLLGSVPCLLPRMLGYTSASTIEHNTIFVSE